MYDGTRIRQNVIDELNTMLSSETYLASTVEIMKYYPDIAADPKKLKVYLRKLGKKYVSKGCYYPYRSICVE